MNRYKNDKADETRMIRFIDPNYRELFQIPDGAYVEGEVSEQHSHCGLRMYG